MVEAAKHPHEKASMGRSRVSIGWLMVAVGLIGFHLAVVCAYPPVFGLDSLEAGLLPGVTALAVWFLSTRGRRGERSGPFARGFVASLSVAICVYIVCCLTIPDLVRWPIVYYINKIEPHLYDADLTVVYRLSLEIQGLIVGLPQLLFALGGGVAAKAIATASSSRSLAAQPAKAITAP
jgi:hypothetical protein